MATLPTSEELIALFDQGMLANEMARRFGLNDKIEIQTVEALCTELHNTGNIDLLQLVESHALQRLNGHDFFTATNFFCRILPELEVTPARIMACVEALVIRAGKDFAANQPNAAFRAWCTRNPDHAQEVIAAAHEGDELASRLLTFALEAINAISEARQIALAYDDVRRLSAITALGRIQDDDTASRTETLATFSTILDSGADDNLRAYLLSTTAAILEYNQDTLSPAAVTLVSRLVEDAGEFTVHQAAHVLCANRKALKPDIITSLLKALLRLNPANKGTVSELDLGLQTLLELEYNEITIDFVTELLTQPDISLELNEFDSFSRTLVSSSSKCLSRVVVRWLLQGTSRLCGGLDKALQDRDQKGPQLDLRAEDLAISSPAQVFICRKAIGWFFLKPITAASVLVSVLRICNDETALEVQNLLVEILLLNYSCIRDYLEGLAPNDAARGRADQALAQNEIYQSSLKTIPLIKELLPSEHHRRIEQLRIADQMRDAHKNAESKSVFLSLVKRSVLLYGNRSISFIKDGNDTLQPVEMDLKPYEFSFEMPRMEIVDPVGLDLTLRVFRTERMAS